VLRKSNAWLLSANALSLALVLYGCCFINAPRLVASYNIVHSRESGGTGPNLDLQYLASLGPEALPIIEARIKEIPALLPIAQKYRNSYEAPIHQANWRGWGFRAWRLQRYLANNPPMLPDPSDSGKG
jgi:hypothetical protein